MFSSGFINKTRDLPTSLQEIETAFLAGTPRIDTLICGKIYTIDLCNRVQFTKDDPTRRRAIKRDAALASSVSVAGLVVTLE